jgi:hypothetical protein
LVLEEPNIYQNLGDFTRMKVIVFRVLSDCEELAVASDGVSRKKIRLTTLCIEGQGLCAPVVGNLLAEGESFTSSVFAVFHGHYYYIPVNLYRYKGELKVINIYVLSVHLYNGTGSQVYNNNAHERLQILTM